MSPGHGFTITTSFEGDTVISEFLFELIRNDKIFLEVVASIILVAAEKMLEKTVGTGVKAGALVVELGGKKMFHGVSEECIG